MRSMLTAPALLVALAGLTVTASGQNQPQVARGVVFEDVDGNGSRGRGEPGVEGVLVSNGRNVAEADRDGRYELPITDDTTIFVIKPTGYRTRIDERNLPRFYRIHKPAGSPDGDFRFKGVAPTGPLPESVDFPLVRQNEPTDFTVLVLGDTQPYTLEEVDYVARDVLVPLKEQGAHGAKFAISLGDLVGDDLSLFEPLNDAQAILGIPFYNVYGNHDMNFMSGQSEQTKANPDRYADETYEATYGPATYAFEYGGVSFINLDNVVWKGFQGLRGDGRPQNGNYEGGLRDDQLEFIENYLESVPEDRLVVLSMHVPLEGEGVHRVPQLDRLLAILSRFPNTLSMSGHTHIQRHWFFGSDRGYTPAATAEGKGQNDGAHHHLNSVTVSGSWWKGVKDEIGIPVTTMRDGAPNGYTLLHIDGDRYTSEFRAARAPAQHQMTIWLPEGLDTTGAGGDDLVVNVFNGSERSETRVRVLPLGDAGSATAWTPLRYEIREDPFYVDQKSREFEGMNTKPLPNPEQSAHLFVGEIPQNLPAGVHVLEVESTDHYGNTVRGQRSFRVE